MEQSRVNVSFVLLSLAASGLSAQDRTPVSSITGAQWSEYRSYYPKSALCADDEVTLWMCETRKSAYALCASPEVNRRSGYFQYRAGRNGRVTFTYPGTKRPPSGLFEYTAYGNGNASLEFVNAGYRYTLLDPLRGESSILVASVRPGAKDTEIACAGNQTLQLNYTLRLMVDSGVWPGN